MSIKNQFLAATAVAAILGWAAGTAQAAPVTFFGEDLNPTGNTPIPTPLSDDARNSFFDNLTGVSTETFEEFNNGDSNLNVTFPGSGITANLSGGTIQNFSSAGRFAISSPNYYNAATSSFAINFTAPISAFGFYGTDIGDFGGVLSLTLTDIHGNMSSLVVPAAEGSGGSSPESGSALYFGFFDLTDQYTSVVFNNTNTVDNFGFDNFSVGNAQEVTPTVPEASTWLMMILGFAGLGGAGYFRAKAHRSSMA
jgi:hypothetical protein